MKKKHFDIRRGGSILLGRRQLHHRTSVVETTLDMRIGCAPVRPWTLIQPTDGHRFVHRPVTKHHVGQVSRETHRGPTIYIYIIYMCVYTYVYMYDEESENYYSLWHCDAMVMAGVTLQMDCRAIV